MRDDGSARHGADYCDDASDIEKQSVGDRQNISLQEDLAQNSDEAVVTIVVSKGESYNAVGVKLKSAGKSSEGVHCIGDVADDMSISPKKAHLSRYTSSHEECRVCQQEKDENLIDLGCHCRGGLSKAHKSCINMWFRTRGSNKCEICQQVAVNVASPESHQAHTSYWVWMVDPAVRGSTIAQEHGRVCFSPLWVAFSILIGALLLDVLISITLGVSALPVNIIIGVIVVLGLGTALRLALEFCHEWSVRRVVHRVEANVHLGYHPTL